MISLVLSFWYRFSTQLGMLYLPSKYLQGPLEPSNSLVDCQMPWIMEHFENKAKDENKPDFLFIKSSKFKIYCRELYYLHYFGDDEPPSFTGKRWFSTSPANCCGKIRTGYLQNFIDIWRGNHMVSVAFPRNIGKNHPNHPNWLSHMFQRGGPTTKQKSDKNGV